MSSSQGSGDVLISYENEAIDVERQGKPVEHVIPPQTFKIENPVAVVTTSAHLDAANGVQELPVHRRRARRYGPRPVSGRSIPAVAADFRDQFPVPAKLWTIADLGGWSAVDPQLFDKNTGSITKIYTAGHRMTAAIDPIHRRSGPSSPAVSSGEPSGFRAVARHALASGRRGVDLVAVIVLLPLAAIAWQSARAGAGRPSGWRSRRIAALESFRVTLTISVAVTVLNMVFGLLIAWVLVRDDFPGKRLVDAIIDLPFALPTIVASLVMLALYGHNSPVGLHLQHTHGVWASRWRSSRCRSWCVPFSRCSWNRPRGRGGGGVAGRQRRRQSSPRCTAVAAARRCCPVRAWHSRARSANSVRWC